MMKKTCLYKINVVLLALLLPALGSSLLQEFLRGANLHCLTNNTLTIIHLVICLPMLLFVCVHLWANCGNMASVVAGIKSAVTRFANENNVIFAWQQRFYEHIVRHQTEMNRIAEYIEQNPYNWATDEYNI